ncbi:MAG: hypothetical protein EBZ67_03480 [Chitinophagia bacterium]|nr:hypothetical protein [Chitinophagia bacterium]
MENPDKKETTGSSGSHPSAADRPQSVVRKPWRKPEAKLISKFTILALGPTPGALENFTFSNKSI